MGNTMCVQYLTRSRLQEILDRCPMLHIGVIGDLGLDAYWYADMTRSFLSRETPRFPRPVTREVYTPGAGANVADNLKALGVGEVTVFSVLGEDWRGALLRQVMEERNINGAHLLSSPQRSTTTFIKPLLQGYDSQQEDARLDFENDTPLSLPLETALVDEVTASLPDLHALLIADQLEINGIITETVRIALNNLATIYPDKVFVVDSRINIGLFSPMVLKPNRYEATAVIYPDRDPRELDRAALAQVGQALSRRTERPVFMTLGAEGALACTSDEMHYLSAGPVQPPLDPVGAGDTFIAALATSLAAGATPWEAGTVANLAAAVTVEKLDQTGTASPEEILKRYDLAGQHNESIAIRL
ncbi:MAG: hypothetical protein JXA33_20485 [Anaerolineae bacterium]|nr:hypothetical protein [Anaerolineae bacterium]